jgi:hypothetical protein
MTHTKEHQASRARQAKVQRTHRQQHPILPAANELSCGKPTQAQRKMQEQSSSSTVNTDMEQ